MSQFEIVVDQSKFKVQSWKSMFFQKPNVKIWRLDLSSKQIFKGDNMFFFWTPKRQIGNMCVLIETKYAFLETCDFHQNPDCKVAHLRSRLKTKNWKLDMFVFHQNPIFTVGDTCFFKNQKVFSFYSPNSVFILGVLADLLEDWWSGVTAVPPWSLLKTWQNICFSAPEAQQLCKT